MQLSEFNPIPTTNECIYDDIREDIKTVKDSEIGTIAYGTDRLVVNTLQTDIEYEYTTPSRPCILGLSIAENLEFIEVDLTKKINDLKIDATQILENIMNKKFNDFIKNKIYKSEECAICLLPNNDCILYTCAHNCGHYKCMESITRCPICRTYISAKIKEFDKKLIQTIRRPHDDYFDKLECEPPSGPISVVI